MRRFKVYSVLGYQIHRCLLNFPTVPNVGKPDFYFSEHRKPFNMMNILYLHSHDTGRHIQPFGHAVAMPHLQKLAESGVLFRNNHCICPTCSPSRSALLTGTYPHQNGMMGLASPGRIPSIRNCRFRFQEVRTPGTSRPFDDGLWVDVAASGWDWWLPSGFICEWEE